MNELVDLKWLYDKSLVEVKFLGVHLAPQAPLTFTRKDGSVGRLNHFGYVLVQIPSSMAVSRFNFGKDEAGQEREKLFVAEYDLLNPAEFKVFRGPKRDAELAYVSYDLPIGMVDIDFSVSQKYGGKRSKGNGILTLPLKSWDDAELFVGFPTKHINEQYKSAIWLTHKNRWVEPEVSRALGDIVMAMIGAYGTYNQPPVTIYNGRPLVNGCHNCRYLHRYSSEETGEYSIGDLKEYEVSRVNNCVCTKTGDVMLQEAYDLYNASMTSDKDYVALRDRNDYPYWMLAGQGKVPYNGRVLAWEGLFNAVAKSSCCGDYSFYGTTNRGFYSAPLSPSVIFHSRDNKGWVQGKPTDTEGCVLGFFPGGHVVVTVDHPDYVKMICANKTLPLTHQVREIVSEPIQHDLYLAYKAVVLAGLKRNIEKYGDENRELLLRLSLEDILINEDKKLYDKLYADVVELLEIGDREVIATFWELLEEMKADERRPLDTVKRIGWEA